jgi:uncharacterized membrane protein
MTETPPPAAPAPTRISRARTPRWLLAVLVLSLGVNALVVGIVLRSLWHLRAAAAMSVDGLPSTFGTYVRQLPPQRQEALAKELREGHPQILTMRRDLRQARQDAAQRFVAEPFDKEAFTAALARVRDAETALRERMQSRLPDLAASMSLEERRSFVRWWQGRPGGRGRPPGPGPDDGPARRRGD